MLLSTQEVIVTPMPLNDQLPNWRLSSIFFCTRGDSCPYQHDQATKGKEQGKRKRSGSPKGKGKRSGSPAKGGKSPRKGRGQSSKSRPGSPTQIDKDGAHGICRFFKIGTCNTGDSCPHLETALTETLANFDTNRRAVNHHQKRHQQTMAVPKLPSRSDDRYLQREQQQRKPQQPKRKRRQQRQKLRWLNSYR